MSDMVIRITLDAAQLKKELGLTQDELKRVDGKEIAIKTEKAKSSIASLRDGLAMWGLAVNGAITAARSFVGAINAIIAPASEMEQLRLRLVSLYQDADLAAAAFDKFRDVASRTPASLQEVIEAGASLKAFGLNAEETLESVSDLAAYMGLDVVQAAQAVGRAFAGGVGAADVLRERGVLELIKSFKGVEDLTEMTLPDFREAMLSTFSDSAAGIAGSSDRMAQSFAGIKSNTMDVLTNLTAYIGSQLTPTIGAAMSAFSGLANKMLEKQAFEEQKRQIISQRVDFELLANRYERLRHQAELTKDEQADYKETIDSLMSGYPNYLKNIDLERDSWEKVSAAMKSAGIELQKLVNAQIQEAVYKKYSDEIVEFAVKTSKLTTELELLQAEFDAGIKKRTMLVQTLGNAQAGQHTATVERESADAAREKRLIAQIESRKAKEQDLNKELSKQMEIVQRLYAVTTPPSDKKPTPATGAATGQGSGSTSGTGTPAAVKEEISETAKAYEQLLMQLQKYHDERALVGLSAHQKRLAELSTQFEAEQQIVLDALAAQEITEEEAEIRLAAIRTKYNEQTQASQIAADAELVELAQKRMDQAVQDEETYYETMKFADADYYEWKKEQIRAEVEAMAIGDAEKLELIKQHIAELDALKEEYSSTDPETKGNWFFHDLLGFDPDNEEDIAKVQAIKDTYQSLASQAQSITGGLMNLSRQRKDQEIADLEARAATERMSNEELAAQKVAITKKYESEERRLKNIQKTLSIGNAIMNVAEGVTKALALGPIIGPVLAAVVSAMGAIQIGIIKAQKFATGGKVTGPGGPKDDKIPALLSNGEFVVNADATSKHLPLLEMLNERGRVRLDSLDRGLLFRIGEDRNMKRYFAGVLGMISATRLAKVGKYAAGGLAGKVIGSALSDIDGASIVVGSRGMNLGSKLDKLIEKVEILNMNLVKKDMKPVLHISGTARDSIRVQDQSRARMEELGYDPGQA